MLFVGIGGVDKQSTDTGKEWAIDVYVGVIIHELFHVAGVESHRRMATEAFRTLSDDEKKSNPLPRKETKLPSDDMENAYNRYFSKLMNIKCPELPRK